MTGLSIWEQETYFAPKDIIIVGSGFTGLWSAWSLKKKYPRLSITILERGMIPSGASTRNAGFACFGSATELISDVLGMGEDALLELVEMRYRGLKKIRKVFGSRTIGYEKNGGYELIAAGQALDMDILRSNIDRLNRRLKKIVKKEKTFRLRDEKIKQFGFAGVQHLVENGLEGQLHAGKLCLALLKEVQSMGVLVLNNISVDHLETTNDGVFLQTTIPSADAGPNRSPRPRQHVEQPSVSPLRDDEQLAAPAADSPASSAGRPLQLFAKKVLVCTNAYAKQLLPELDVVPARGQVLVTSPIEGLSFKGTFHFEEGFYYFRNLGDRVLLGGARNKSFETEKTFERTTTDPIQQELERFLRETILPGKTFHIEHRWSGIMGMGMEKMPILRAINDHLFCAVRMSGMGVALAPVIGEKVAALLSP